MKTLYIIRGLPGSGKSTYAKSLGIPYFEADMYFYKDGVYNFDPTRLRYAHRRCFNTVSDHIKGKFDVAVSNTFTTLKEVIEYVEVAKQHDYRIVIVDVKTAYGSIHDVPESSMDRMRRRWVDIPKEYYDELITIE